MANPTPAGALGRANLPVASKTRIFQSGRSGGVSLAEDLRIGSLDGGIRAGRLPQPSKALPRCPIPVLIRSGEGDRKSARAARALCSGNFICAREFVSDGDLDEQRPRRRLTASQA